MGFQSKDEINFANYVLLCFINMCKKLEPKSC